MPPRGSVVARPASHDMASPRSSRSSVASSTHLQDVQDLLRAQNAEAERLERQYKEEEEAKKGKIEQMAQAAITNIYGTAVDKVMRMQQEKEAERQKQQQRESSLERKTARENGWLCCSVIQSSTSRKNYSSERSISFSKNSC